MQLSVFPSGLCWTILRHQPSLVAWDYLIVPKHRNIRKLLYGVQVINEICTWTMPTMSCNFDYSKHNQHLIVNYRRKKKLSIAQCFLIIVAASYNLSRGFFLYPWQSWKRDQYRTKWSIFSIYKKKITFSMDLQIKTGKN